MIFDPSTGEILELPIEPKRMVELYAYAKEQVTKFKAMQDKLDFEMLTYMLANRQTGIPHELYEVGLKGGNTYNPAEWVPALDLLEKVDLDEIYTEGYNETVQVPASWAGASTVERVLKRYGPAGVDIFEASRTANDKKLDFKPRPIQPVPSTD